MAASKQNSSIIMERKAINSSGHLGSLYDGYRDHVIARPNTDAQEQCWKSSEQAQCKLIRGDDGASKNLLQWIGIQDELRISLLLKLTKRYGIGASLDYSHRIDQYTRFLYYSFIKYESEFKKIPEFQKISELWTTHASVTHMITGVRYGIDLLIVIQLPSKTNINDKIDSILKKIPDILWADKNHILHLTSAQNSLLEHVISTTVYSNMPSLTCLNKVSDVLHQIKLIRYNSDSYRPLSYTLKLITTLYPPQMRTAIKMSHPLQARKTDSFRLLSPLLKDYIDQDMLQFRNMLKYVEASLEENVPQVLCKKHQHLLNEAWDQLSLVTFIYMKEIQRFAKLIVNTRGDPVNTSEISQALHDNKLILKKSIKTLTQILKEFNIKDPWSTNLGTIERNLVSDDSCNQTLDYINASSESNQFILTNQQKKTIEKYKNNSMSSLADVEFLDSSLQVSNTAISSSDENNHNENHSKQKASSPNHASQTSSAITSSPPLIDKFINIVLLGETGVGKSTFINAFANYLTFSSLEQAQSHEPIVLIPASFTMTIGDNFEERTIKFGEFDSLNNENFNSVGQSVTQHCKSYVFDLHQFDGKKLRIIDTPGFGDTRGLDQDDQNMEHILQYINNLTYLNAICFLLKPNSSRLNMFFRTCLTQLFSFLNPDACKNVIFCFTNGRSTFYTPGDTAPLLKTMLQSLSIDGIRFEKENTFCFDSESFRYLVALQNEVPFNKEDKYEYETSWSTSVKESNRLIKYIDRNISPHDIGSGWKSIKHAQFEISHMIRPILETMRNILRNQILCENHLSNKLIELSSKAVHCTATRCRVCKSDPEQVGKFWVISSALHEFQDECRQCSCTLDQHVPIDCTREYKCWSSATSDHENGAIDKLNILCNASAEFARFLMHTGYCKKGDPFLVGLEEMIDEENQICERQKSSDFNSYLVKKLTKLQELYESCKQKISEKKSNQGSIDLPDIYRSIDTIGKYPMVYEQIVAVKQSKQIMMKDYEYEAERI